MKENQLLHIKKTTKKRTTVLSPHQPLPENRESFSQKG